MLKVGQEARIYRDITEQLINNFALVSTDYNPIHVNEDYAKNSRWGKRIAHGMLAASFISSLIGNDFPGNGTIYLGQTLKFQAPVFIGERLEIVAKVLSINNNRAVLSTEVYNQEGELKVTGEAKVMLP